MKTCDEIRDLAPEFALGLVTPEDELEVLGHLDGCSNHPEFAEYRASLLALDLALEPVQPSVALGERIARDRHPTTARRYLRPYWLAGIAASLAIIVMALAVWQFNGGTSGIDRSFETDSGIEVTVHAPSNVPDLQLSFANLETAPGAGNTYTAWAIRDKAWLMIGVFSANENGAWSGSFAFQLHDGDALCLTRGASSGDDSPRGETLFIEPL